MENKVSQIKRYNFENFWIGCATVDGTNEEGGKYFELQQVVPSDMVQINVWDMSWWF